MVFIITKLKQSQLIFTFQIFIDLPLNFTVNQLFQCNSIHYSIIANIVKVTCLWTTFSIQINMNIKYSQVTQGVTAPRVPWAGGWETMASAGAASAPRGAWWDPGWEGRRTPATPLRDSAPVCPTSPGWDVIPALRPDTSCRLLLVYVSPILL